MKSFYAKNGEEWRNWLQRNHLLEDEIWLEFYRKGTEKPGVDFDEAIDWALCFGWIDSAIRKIDAVRYARRFTPRRPGSSWSKSNVQKAEALVAEGRMTEYGAAVFRKRTVKT